MALHWGKLLYLAYSSYYIFLSQGSLALNSLRGNGHRIYSLTTSGWRRTELSLRDREIFALYWREMRPGHRRKLLWCRVWRGKSSPAGAGLVTRFGSLFEEEFEVSSWISGIICMRNGCQIFLYIRFDSGVMYQGCNPGYLDGWGRG